MLFLGQIVCAVADGTCVEPLHRPIARCCSSAFRVFPVRRTIGQKPLKAEMLPVVDRWCNRQLVSLRQLPCRLSVQGKI